MTQQQAYQQFIETCSIEFEKVNIPWDNELREWHKWALHAMKFASPQTTQFPQERWGDLFETPQKGLNCNVFSVLSNNIQTRTQDEMELDEQTYITVLQMNAKAVQKWHKISDPISKSVNDRLRIMNAVDNKVSRGLKIIN
jgi:hypothetical protein